MLPPLYLGIAMYKIIILMVVSNLTGMDAVIVDMKYGKPLHFDTVEECIDHIYYNREALKAYAKTYFNSDTPVKGIDCFVDITNNYDREPQTKKLWFFP